MNDAQTERIHRGIMFVLLVLSPVLCWLIWRSQLAARIGPMWGWIVLMSLTLFDAAFYLLLAAITGNLKRIELFVRKPELTRSYLVPADSARWSDAMEERLKGLGIAMKVEPHSGSIQLWRPGSGVSGFFHSAFSGEVAFDTTTVPARADLTLRLEDTLLFETGEREHLNTLLDFIAGVRPDCPVRVYPGLVSSSVTGLLLAAILILLSPLWMPPVWIVTMLSFVSGATALIGLINMMNRKEHYLGLLTGLMSVVLGGVLTLAQILVAVLAIDVSI